MASPEAAGSSGALYDWWLSALPAFLGAKNGGAGTGDTPLPFPADRLSGALGQTRALLDALFGGYLRALIASQPGDEVRAFEELLQERLAGVTDQLSALGQTLSGHPDLAKLGLAGAPLAAMGEALKPLALNVERAYGGLADAFGLAPLRELQQAASDLTLAAFAHRRAQAEYLDVVAGALGKGAEALVARLSEMGQRGESVDTLLALTRLWARTTDQAMHDAMQSPRALKASAELLRAASRSRRQQQRVVAIASEALNVPTRAEMDEAYREIQQLKRELRRLRQGGVLAGPPAEAAAPPARKRPARPRAAPKGTPAP